MPTRALVLSSDEKALDAVSHVLGELEISFEQFHDVAFAIKRLEGQAFDLLVIDCDQQQEAVRLLDSMRSSNLNRGAMTVAIVDGRAGVPIAFRLGAELVIPKPVSLEQARSTLRTAVAMHRKTHPEAKVLIRPAPVLVQPAATPAKPKPAIPFSEAKLAVPKPKPVNSTPSLGGPMDAEPGSKKETKRGLSLSLGAGSKQEPALELISEQPGKSAHDHSGYPLPAETFEPNSAKRSIHSGLVAALVLAVIGAGGYGAYIMVPGFRATVDANYRLLRSQIPGGKPPVAAVVAKPSRPAVKPAPAPVPAVPPDGFVASTESLAITETAAPAEPKPVLLATTATTTSAPEEPAPVTVPDDLADRHVSSRVDPVYPETLRRKGVRGDVVLQALVAKDGTVDSISVISGNPLLAAAAMDAVKQWKYQTYLHNGTPASFQTNVTVAFEPAPKSAH